MNNQPAYSEWPCKEFERGFFRPVRVGGFLILVPAYKLGRGQISIADKARREAVRLILRDETLLNEVRAQQKDELHRNIEAAQKLLSEATKTEDREVCAQLLVSLNASKELDDEKEATDADCDYYIGKHRSDDELFKPWLSALYRPFAGSPPIEELYPYIPVYLFTETQNFFVESLNESKEKSEGTETSSTVESPQAKEK